MTHGRRALMWVCGSMICLGMTAAGSAQVSGTAQIPPRKQPQRARRETNASRQARIARTINDTYAHRYEIFGGGGYLRWRSGEFTQKNNEISWVTSTTYYLTPRLGIVGDARGSFGYAKAVHGFGDAGQTQPGFQVSRPQINEYFFTGGVNYRVYAKEKLGISLQGTGGAAWGIFSGGAKGLSYQQTGTWADGTKPAFIFNANIDYNIYPNLGVRISPTYVGTNFGGEVENNLGLNAGVIYRFGSIGKK